MKFFKQFLKEAKQSKVEVGDFVLSGRQLAVVTKVKSQSRAPSGFEKGRSDEVLIIGRFEGGRGGVTLNNITKVIKKGTPEHTALVKKYNPYGLKKGDKVRQVRGSNTYKLISEPNLLGDATAILIKDGETRGVGIGVNTKDLKPL